MGAQINGSTIFKYKTKSGFTVEYIYYDLKGKGRFPDTPANEAEVNAMFDIVLSDIEAPPDRIAFLRDLSPKYKHRFAVKHKRVVKEYEERMRSSGPLVSDTKPEINFKLQIDEKLSVIGESKSVLKVELINLEKYVNDKGAYIQFLEVDGVNRLLNVLEKQIKINKEGTRTNFSNQVEILKFIKLFSDKHPKEFFPHVTSIPNYPETILKAYHPVNVAVAAYSLALIEDYIWRVEEGADIVEALKKTVETKDEFFLQRFANTLQQSNNILMIYYNLKFINDLIAGVIQEDQKMAIQNQRVNIKYELILENIKAKFQDNSYKLEYCTFTHVHQQIYQYATRQKNNDQQIPVRSTINLNPNPRNTMNLQMLHQHILNKFIDTQNDDKQTYQDEEEVLTVYLTDSGKKQFNRYFVETLIQIQNYFKLQVVVNPDFEGENGQFSQTDINEARMDQVKLQDYMKHIRSSCVKNGCNQELLSTMKNLQYFERAQWRRIEVYAKEQMGLTKKSDQMEALRKQLEEKQMLIKKIYRQNQNLKAEKLSSTQLVGISLPPPPSDVKKNQIKLSSTLPPPPNTENKLGSNLPPPPPSILNTGQLSQNEGFHLPPPPNSNLSKLPPPPTMSNIILPPPPNLSNTLLPPPPTLNNALLPPPPNMNSTSLPPPPSLNNTILPPPPSMSNTILPPPPSLSGLSLPPPPLLSGTSLPPPPSLSGMGLPPPPSLSGIALPPPPSLSGISLPPPPSFGGSGLPPLPSMGGLPPIGGLPGLSNSDIKKKEKRKPAVALKGCPYSVLPPQKVAGTIWENVDDEKIQLDTSQIEQLFAKNVQAKNQEKIGTQSAILSSPTRKEAIKLLGSDRWRNVEIVLTKQKIPRGKMSQALRNCSGKYATSTVLQSISKILPSEEEQQTIINYQGPVEDLASPERFFKEVMEVPEYKSRITAMIFASIKEELYAQLGSKLDQLTTAFSSLKDDFCLKHVLEVTLAVGNYLNGTSFKGGAYGFKLDSLDRIQEVKSKDNKMNAAFYVVRQVWKKYAYPIFDKDCIDMYNYTTKMPVSQIQVEIADVRKYAAAVQKAISSHNPDDSSDMIGAFCEQIKVEVDGKFVQFEEKFKKLEQAYQDCATFYCQDPRKQSSDQIGKKIYKSVLFISNTEKTLKVVEERWKKEQDRKAKKNELVYVQEGDKSESNETGKKNNPESAQRVAKSTIGVNNLPKPPMPPINIASKEERFKEFQKTQQEREKKALEEVIKKRISKMTALRNSKLPTLKNMDSLNTQQLAFLKGLK